MDAQAIGMCYLLCFEQIRFFVYLCNKAVRAGKEIFYVGEEFASPASAGRQGRRPLRL